MRGSMPSWKNESLSGKTAERALVFVKIVVARRGAALLSLATLKTSYLMRKEVIHNVNLAGVESAVGDIGTVIKTQTSGGQNYG
jgi:hypothetical protein